MGVLKVGLHFPTDKVLWLDKIHADRWFINQYLQVVIHSNWCEMDSGATVDSTFFFGLPTKRGHDVEKLPYVSAYVCFDTLGGSEGTPKAFWRSPVLRSTNSGVFFGGTIFGWW